MQKQSGQVNSILSEAIRDAGEVREQYLFTDAKIGAGRDR
jgi:hypothetical protein